jgi:hypothetical protein
MGNQRAERWLLVCVTISTCAVGGLLTFDSFVRADDLVRCQEFQLLVQGLGFGSTVVNDQCPFAFDPRLQSACAHIEGPIPGGFFLCPMHVGTTTSYPYLPSTPMISTDGDDHAATR